MLKKIKSFISNESGQGLTEYAIIVALLVIVVIAVVTNIGKKMNNKFENINNALQ